MSKPLIANPKRTNEARAFHRHVFQTFGYTCFFCGCKASDAAHVVGRAHLSKLRYADPRLARPLCRSCHRKVDRHEIEWPVAVKRDAIEAHNMVAKVKLELP